MQKSPRFTLIKSRTFLFGLSCLIAVALLATLVLREVEAASFAKGNAAPVTEAADAAGADAGGEHGRRFSENILGQYLFGMGGTSPALFASPLFQSSGARSMSLGGGSRVDVPSSASLNITGPITVEAWVKTNSAADQAIVERYATYPGAGVSNGGYVLRLMGGRATFSTLRNSNEFDYVQGATAVTTGVWHHVAGVFDGSQLRVYLDGTLDGSKASTFAPATGTAPVRIGAKGDDRTIPFSGLIDEARVSAAALYGANFTPATNLTPINGVKGLWKFDDQAAGDSSGYGNNGTLIASASFSTETCDNTPPAPDNSLSLGGGAKVQVPSSASLNITGPITVEAWVKTNSAADQAIVERYATYPGAGVSNGGYVLRLMGGRATFSTLRNSNEFDYVQGATAVTTGVWHHVAGVFDGSQLRVYLDGALDGSKASTFAPATGTAPVRIGAKGDDQTIPFSGLIDEARVSAAALYGVNFTPATRLSAVTNVRGLWKFDDQTANDSSGNSNHGTLLGGASFSADTPHHVSNTPPLADAGGPYSVAAATNLQFNGNASYDTDGTVTSYAWNFGDGQSGTGVSPSHAYASSGTYTVTLTVTDDAGGTGHATTTVSVSNHPPAANAGGPYSGQVNASIQFGGTASTDPDGTITDYKWDFGDGGYGSNSAGPTPTHAYANGGYYTGTLTVTDNSGATASTTFNVRVGKTPPGGVDTIVAEDVSWNSDNSQSARDIENDRGRPANHPEGNNNFQLTAPVISLPGRGLKLDLSLFYNSLVWNKFGGEMAFDIDQDWPAPGWQLGFGKMIDMGQAGAMLVEPDGTRHNFSGTVFPFATGDPVKPNATFFKGSTTDGSFIEYRLNSSFYPVGVARYPDGSVIYYSNYSDVASRQYLYATDINDANGNLIHIKYDWEQREPRIKFIVDSLGRVITFHYDDNKLLTAVTASGVRDAAGSVTTRTLVRLHYKQLALSYSFGPKTARVRNSTPWVIDAIYYPATGTGYWFGDGDSYSSYGMIRKVSERRGMTFSTPSSDPALSLRQQGTVTPGVMSRQQEYDYPATAASVLGGAPTYNTLTETWDGMTTPPAVTTYEIENPAAPADRKVTVTRPDKTRLIQYSHNLSNLAEGNLDKQKTGLVYLAELRDEQNTLLQKTTTTWEVPASKTPRVTRSEVTDERNQTLATAYQEFNEYNGAGRVLQYDYAGSVLRTTRYAYTSYTDADLETKANAVAPRLINLVTSEKVYDGDDAANKLAGLTEYRYDEYAVPLQSYTPNYDATFDLIFDGVVGAGHAGPGIVLHAARFNPLPPSATGGSGSAYITKRGNVTSVVKYAELANPAAPASPVTEKRTYDMAGNLVASSSTCCEQTSYTYDEVTKYAYPSFKTRGAVAATSLLRVTTGIEYDFNTGLPLSTTDENGNKTVNVYDPASWRLTKSVQAAGSLTTYDYDDSNSKVTETVLTASGGAVAGRTVKYFNGRAELRQQAATNALGTTDVVDTEYDVMGRALRQTRPYRGSDAKWWVETVYDAAGRVKELKQPYDGPASSEAADRSVTKTFYNEATRPAGASAEPGQTARAVDAWGRWRWTRLNASGKLVEVVEQNPDGGSGLVTRYTYDALGNLSGVQQDTQSRRFRYDALGRLTHQKLAETEARLNAAGEIATGEPLGERWGDVYKYDERSNLTSHTDARGVRTNYDYGTDPLNRLQNVTYVTTRVNASVLTVAPAPNVHFNYRAKTTVSQARDVTQVESVTSRYPGASQDFAAESYAYDSLGRVEKKTQTVAGRPPFETSFAYDTLGRVKGLTYPAQYAAGVTNPARKSVAYNFGTNAQVSGVTVDGAGLVSQVSYGADGQLTALTLGTGDTRTNETYEYAPKSGLIVNQRVKWAVSPDAQSLMDLTYQYQLSYSYNPTGYPADIDRRAYTGQVTRIVSVPDNQVENYSYDSLGRVRQLREDFINFCIEGCSNDPGRSAVWTQDYSYDKFGNRTATTKTSFSVNRNPELDGRPVPLTYDDKTNRLTSSAYDPAGNMTQDVSRTYIYDAANRLSKVKESGNTLESYAYGASNERLITYHGDESSPVKTYYVWNGGAVIADYSEGYDSPTSPRWAKSYIYTGARLLASYRPGDSGGEGVQYYHPNRRGAQVTNGSDGIVNLRTLPFGTALSSESWGTPDNRQFTSYDRSAMTRLDYAVNRYYDPSQGRFTQVDPAGIAAADLTNPQTLNMYAYCANDPVNRVDPDGRFFGALVSFVGRFFAGLFHNLSPNQITGSFTYRNLPPVSVSFSGDFRNAAVGFGGLFFQVKNGANKESREDRLIRETIDNVLSIISQQNSCSDFFGGTTAAVAAFKSIMFTHGPISDGYVGIQMSLPPGVPDNFTYRVPTSAMVNENGGFYRTSFFDHAQVKNLPHFGPYAPNTMKVRVLMMLHELGHIMYTGQFDWSATPEWLLPVDGTDKDLSIKNTGRVVDHCKTQIDALK